MGNVTLYKDAVSAVANNQKGADKVNSLEKKLMEESGLSETELFEKGKECAIDLKLQEIRASVEMLVLGIKQRNQAISNMAGKYAKINHFWLHDTKIAKFTKITLLCVA